MHDAVPLTRKPTYTLFYLLSNSRRICSRCHLRMAIVCHHLPHTDSTVTRASTSARFDVFVSFFELNVSTAVLVRTISSSSTWRLDIWISYDIWINYDICISYDIWINYDFWINYYICIAFVTISELIMISELFMISALITIYALVTISELIMISSLVTITALITLQCNYCDNIGYCTAAKRFNR